MKSFLCLFFASLPFAALAHAPAGPTSIGVLILGDLSVSARLASAKLRARIERWAEDEIGGKEGPRLAISSVDRAAFPDLSWWRLVLGARADQILKGPLPAERPPEQDIARAFRSLSGEADSGPWIQRGLLAQAWIGFQKGKRGPARRLLRQALAWHPQGQLPEDFGWEWENSAGGIGHSAFSALAAEIRAEWGKPCEVQWADLPSDARAAVNGFAVSVTDPLQLLPAAAFEVSVKAAGTLRKQRVVCRAEGRYRLSFSQMVAREASSEPDPLSRWESFLIVELVKDRFQLSLYTPHRFFETIPLLAALDPVSVLSEPVTPALPLDPRYFLSLWRKHQGAGVAGFSSAAPLPTLALPPVENEEPPASRWYNKKGFWVAVGAVAVGLGATYFATRGEADKPRSKGLSVQLH